MEKYPEDSSNPNQEWEDMGEVANYQEIQETLIEAGLDSEHPDFDRIVNRVSSLAEEKGKKGEDFTIRDIASEVLEDEFDNAAEQFDLRKDDAADNQADLGKEA